MTTQEAFNRGNNLVATAISALAGFAFAPEILFEKDLDEKADDILIFALGLIAIWWYRKGTNRFSQSIMPYALVGIGLVVKIGAVLIEFKDKEDVGDDFGGLILFLLATILVFWLYKAAKKTIVA